MSAAKSRREQAIDRADLVTVVTGGETVEMPYRRAVGLISLGRAEWATTPKPRKAKKKADVSTPGGSAQEGEEAGNKPPSGDTDSGGA